MLSFTHNYNSSTTRKAAKGVIVFHLPSSAQAFAQFVLTEHNSFSESARGNYSAAILSSAINSLFWILLLPLLRKVAQHHPSVGSGSRLSQ